MTENNQTENKLPAADVQQDVAKPSDTKAVATGAAKLTRSSAGLKNPTQNAAVYSKPGIARFL